MKISHFLLFIVVVAFFAESKPFTSGYSMITGSVISKGNHISGRDPTISAVYSLGDKSFALNTTYISYYHSKNDNYSTHDDRAVLGATLATGKASIKMSFEYFNFLNVYSEKELYSSFAFLFSEKIKGSLNFLYKNRGLLIDNYEDENTLGFGTTLLFDVKNLSFSLEPGGASLLFEEEMVCFDHFYIDFKANTLNGKFFNQGVRVRILPGDLSSTRLFWAISFIGMKNTHLNLNISTNPMLFGCGISFCLKKSTLYFGSSTHPILGTSIVIGMEHLFRRR